MYSPPTTPWQFPIFANIRGNKKNSDSDSKSDLIHTFIIPTLVSRIIPSVKQSDFSVSGIFRIQKMGNI